MFLYSRNKFLLLLTLQSYFFFPPKLVRIYIHIYILWFASLFSSYIIVLRMCKSCGKTDSSYSFSIIIIIFFLNRHRNVPLLPLIHFPVQTPYTWKINSHFCRNKHLTKRLERPRLFNATPCSQI